MVDRPPRAPVSFERALARLDEGYQQPCSIDDLALACGMSSGHFIRAFRQAYGVTPHQYLVQVRLNHAQRLLAAGVSATEAAVEAGFYDQSHLTRWFKRTLGMTPGAFAARPRARGVPVPSPP